LVLRETREQQVHKETKASRVMLVPLALQGPREIPEPLAQPEPQQASL
jgi:hypothetical protein